MDVGLGLNRYMVFSNGGSGGQGYDPLSKVDPRFLACSIEVHARYLGAAVYAHCPGSYLIWIISYFLS